jgi:PIN domain nuclease of toxin-antitoxin system
LWALLEPQQLSPGLRNALEDSDEMLVVSAASAWEIVVPSFAQSDGVLTLR